MYTLNCLWGKKPLCTVFQTTHGYGEGHSRAHFPRRRSSFGRCHQESRRTSSCTGAAAPFPSAREARPANRRAPWCARHPDFSLGVAFGPELRADDSNTRRCLFTNRKDGRACMHAFALGGTGAVHPSHGAFRCFTGIPVPGQSKRRRRAREAPGGWPVK